MVRCDVFFLNDSALRELCEVRFHVKANGRKTLHTYASADLGNISAKRSSMRYLAVRKKKHIVYGPADCGWRIFNLKSI